MRKIKIHIGREGPKVFLRETETPGTWEMEWTGDTEQRHASRMLKAAENSVLRNGGERILLTCSADQEMMSAELDKWPPSIVSRTGDRCTMELITPGEDGFIHDDDDFRTPLERITCPTCVERFAQSRTRQRQDAFGKGERPKGDSQAYPADRRGLRPAGGNRREPGNMNGTALQRQNSRAVAECKRERHLREAFHSMRNGDGGLKFIRPSLVTLLGSLGPPAWGCG